MTERLQLVVMISGNGSNLQAIIDAIESGFIQADIKAVVSNDGEAFGLQRALHHGLQTQVIDHHDFETRQQFDLALQTYLKSIDPDFIILAGFMRILGADIIQAFEHQIINIHPSLLPAYKGLNTHQRALDNGETKHGVSIHLVTADLDAGPVIMQAEYPIEKGDSVEDLQSRGHQLEHMMYPQLLAWLGNRTLSVKGGQVFHEDSPLEKPVLLHA